MAITVRKISKRIKEQIIERDGACIICGGQIQQIHHVFMGSKQIIDPTGTKQTSSFDFVPRVTISSTLTAGTIFERKVNNILRKYWQTKKYSYNTRALILNILFMAKILNPLPGEREENVRSFGSLFQKIKEMEEIFPGEGKRLGKFFATGSDSQNGFSLRIDCRKISPKSKKFFLKIWGGNRFNNFMTESSILRWFADANTTELKRRRQKYAHFLNVWHICTKQWSQVKCGYFQPIN